MVSPSLQTAEVRGWAVSTAGAVGVPAQSRQWEQTAFKVPSYTEDSMILCMGLGDEERWGHR